MNYMDVPIGATVPFLFDSFAGTTGASVTLTGLIVGDVKIKKDTALTAQPTPGSGVALLDTDGIDVGSITGIHGFSINTGDTTDAGYFSVGSYYNVIVNSVTIDSQTVNFLAGAFRLLPAEGQAGHQKVDAQYVAGAAPENGTAIADAILDRTNGVETSYTPRQALRAIAAAAAGKVAGAGTAAITISALGNPATTRIVTASSDADGNRPTVTLSLT